MLKYYSWALAEKTLSFLPMGKQIYTGLGYAINRKSRGFSVSLAPSFKLVRKGIELVPDGGSVLEIGTGWHHRDAFLLYLAGNYRVYLFDIEDKARMVYLQNYLQYLMANSELIAKELEIDESEVERKLKRINGIESRKEIYVACNFVPLITTDIKEPFLPEQSIDYMLSNCVLNHIPLEMLRNELVTLRKMLKENGHMFHLIGHDDHWTFHDPSANTFNYYRYSDKYYRMFFETAFEFHNRMVKQEWLPIFDQCGLKIAGYEPHLTDDTRDEISRLPFIDQRFAKYPKDELAILYSFFLLEKQLLEG